MESSFKLGVFHDNRWMSQAGCSKTHRYAPNFLSTGAPNHLQVLSLLRQCFSEVCYLPSDPFLFCAVLPDPESCNIIPLGGSCRISCLGMLLEKRDDFEKFARK